MSTLHAACTCTWEKKTSVENLIKRRFTCIYTGGDKIERVTFNIIIINYCTNT